VQEKPCAKYSPPAKQQNLARGEPRGNGSSAQKSSSTHHQTTQYSGGWGRANLGQRADEGRQRPRDRTRERLPEGNPGADEEERSSSDAPAYRSEMERMARRKLAQEQMWHQEHVAAAMTHAQQSWMQYARAAALAEPGLQRDPGLVPWSIVGYNSPVSYAKDPETIEDNRYPTARVERGFPPSNRPPSPRGRDHRGA